MNLSLKAYGGFATLAAPLLRRMLARRAAAGKEVAPRLKERFGVAGIARPEGRLIWLHAASVGEALSLLPVIAALEDQAQVLLTTGTVSSAQLMAGRLPSFALHQFAPLDVPGWVERFLDHWRPDAAVFVESEIWPNTLLSLDARGIPRFLLNASLSARSARRWARAKRVAHPLFGGFRAVHAQSAEAATALAALGADPVLTGGDLKLAAPPLPVDEAVLREMRRQVEGPCWLAASTHPGEEAIVLEAHRLLAAEFPALITMLAPRHPTRAEEVAALVARSGLSLSRRSLNQAPAAGIYLIDTLGELGLFYRLCPCALVGGSLVNIGGHNLCEPARLGTAVLTGPFLREITGQVERLRAAGALAEVADAASLAEAVARMLRDPTAAISAGAKAMRAFDDLAALPARLAAVIRASCA